MIQAVRIEWFISFVAMDIELHKVYMAYVEMPFRSSLVVVVGPCLS